MPAQLVFQRKPVDSPVNGTFGEVYTRNDGSTYKHRGIDFECPLGTQVFAPAAGTVVLFTNDGSFGIGVCLDHEGTPWFSLFAHLSAAAVQIGDRVAAGQPIGRTGATGLVTGPHLHWQVCDSSTFPIDISRSCDPLAMFGQPSDPPPRMAGMTAAERELLLQIATVVAGTKDGKDYTAIDAALARFRELAAKDEIILEGLSATQERVGKLEGFVSQLLLRDH